MTHESPSPSSVLPPAPSPALQPSAGTGFSVKTEEPFPLKWKAEFMRLTFMLGRGAR